MDTKLVKQLRDETGASVADCNSCLKEANGNFAEAKVLLRKKGIQIARDKSSRSTSEGIIGSYIHTNGKLGSMVLVKCETDFVARSDEFKELARGIAMHITAMNPLYKTPQDVPETALEKEREIEREKLRKSGKSDAVLEQILTGKMKKYYETVCLLNQPFVKDDKKSIADLINETVQKLGENIEVGKFVRMEL